MKLYSVTDIQIADNRQRQEFAPDLLEELKASIEARGLMHAIVVRIEDGKPWLVAGERRLKALTDIYALDGVIKYNGERISHGAVPTVTLGELDELEAEEAELDENIKRKDLTWQELAMAHERLHRLRQAQTKRKASANPEVEIPAHTVADTARELYPQLRDTPTGELGFLADKTRKEIIVSGHLDKPEIAKAKNLDEAWKILKRSDEAERNRELAAKIGATFNAGVHRVFNEPCVPWMKKAFLSGERFDVILTDPPYGMGAQNFGDGGGKLQGIDHKYDDSYEAWKALMAVWAPLSFAITKPEAHLYAFCDIDRFHELKSMLEAAGWYVFRTPFIDFKTDSGRVPLPDRGPRRQWEMILYAIKGDKPVTHIYPDVIPCQADEQMGHGAQKPVALYVNLLTRSVRPGDKVLDTFGGSGTLIPACHQLQCEATVIEQEPSSYGMCLKRLQAIREAADPLEALR